MEVGDLMIENERLKTTIMILNQKINEQTDTYQELNKLKKKNHELNALCDTYRDEVQNLKSDLSQRDFRINS